MPANAEYIGFNAKARGMQRANAASDGPLDLQAPSSPVLGGEGLGNPPHPQPLSPEYRGEGSNALSARALEKPLMPQPARTRLCPGRTGMVARTDAEVVGGGGIDVQFRRDAGSLQGQVRKHAVL